MDSNPYLSGIESYSPAKPSSYSKSQEDANIQGYLSNLSKAEKADYNTIVGGSTFDDYSKHPGIIGVKTKEGPSTAAGRYQITKTTYDQYAKKLGITDFSPESQDKIALELIKDNGALEDVKQGNYQAANSKLGGVWASLPSSKYDQPKRSHTWVEENFDTAPSKNPYLKGTFKTKEPDTQEPENPYLKGLARPPSNPYLNDVSTGTKSDISATRSFVKSAGGSAAAALASAPTMVAGAELGAEVGTAIAPFLGPAAPAGPIVGGLIGGIGGYLGGQEVIDWAFNKIPDSYKEVFGYDPQTRQKEVEANPESSWHGNLSGNLVLFRPGVLKDIVLEGGKKITPLMQHTAMGVAGGAIEATSEKLAGEDLNAQHILESAGFTAVAAKPTSYLNKINTRQIKTDKEGNITSENWTDSWKVPETTETGTPITLGKIVDAEGNQAVQKDGKPVIARHYRNEDGSSKEIVMDMDEALKRFEDKPWVKAGLEENAFKTPYEYAQFILKHEDEHTRLSFDEWKAMQDPQGNLFAQDQTGVYSEDQLRKDYEHYINRQAYHAIQEDPYISQPDVKVPKIPDNPDENPKWIADSLYSLDKAPERDSIIGRALHEQASKEGVDTAMQQRWRSYVENKGQLDPRELDLFKKYAEKELQEIERLTKYSKNKKWSLTNFLDPSLVGEFAPRIFIRKLGDKWEKVLNVLTKGDFGGFDPNVAVRPGALKGRSLFAGELANGKRVILQQQPDGSVVRWENGKAIPFAKISEVNVFQPGEKVKNAFIKQATEAEIEQHTPFTYEKDFQGVIYQRLSELRQFVRTNQFLEDLTKSKWFHENAIKLEGKTVPEGYKIPKHLDRLPQFQGYAFKDNLAYMIEDFAKSHAPNALTYLSGALIKNMMLNPLPHMMNEGWHLFNARGLTGWVTPAGIYRFAKTGMPALMDVIKQSPNYIKTMEEGGSLLSSRVRNSAFAEDMFAKANREFSQTPEFQSLAKRMAMKPIQLYEAISKKSNIAMWVVRDAMYMQLINEKMMYEGLTRQQAIQDVERHMPSYRIPHKVMGSRALSEVLQNPNITVFSRYHYGLVNSTKNTAMDLAALRKGQAGVKDFLHGADTAAAIALAAALLYPLQDMIAHWLSGNEDATVRRAGPYHIFHALHGVATLEKDPMAVIASFFTFNPALLAGAQLIANRKLYNGQPIYNPEDSAAKIWSDITDYTLGQWPMIGQAMKAGKEEDEGFKNWLMRQIDVESPTSETVMKREKMVGRKEKAGARRTMKWETEQED